MGLNHLEYNKQFLENVKATGNLFSDASKKYGVQLIEADVAEGETYWKVIGIHHLLPRENGSQHNVFLDALDEDGNRVKNPPVWIGWSWLGRRSDENAPPVPLDKPDNEPGTNVVINRGQMVEVWVNGLNRDSKDKSDMVKNLHTNHPDEPLPDGALLNTIGHHSFYVVFQRTRKTATSTGNLADAGVSNLVDMPVANSAISGQVTGGDGKTVLLLLDGQVVDRRVLSGKGFYRFASLKAGSYSVQIENTSLSQNIQVDGSNKQIVNFYEGTGTGVVTSTKLIDHYLLLGPQDAQNNLVLATNYILKFKPTVGFNVEEAKQAQQVTIVGQGISQADQEAIKAAGSQLELLTVAELSAQ